MKQFTAQVHALDMKLILWYSVPFVGFQSALWKRFGQKNLGTYDQMQVGMLDPRYPEIRAYITDTYVCALKEWEIDGFKLDFIDAFRVSDDCTQKEGMDCCSVPMAVEKLLTDTVTQLRAIKPDVLIEFRQGYVGPGMRRYASMFRAVDCPEHYRQNRVGTVDLRLMNGQTLTHSDMLMWNRNDPPEVAALQILNAIFSVIQFSVRFDNLTEAQRKMTKFWFGFWNKNKKLLAQSPIKPQEVQNFYPIVQVEDAETCISAIYEINKILRISLTKENLIINACSNAEVVLDIAEPRVFSYQAFDCMGNVVSAAQLAGGGIVRIAVPQSGLLVIR